MTSHNEFIDALGGNAAVARLLTEQLGKEITAASVGMWKRRGSIPHRRRPVLNIIAAARGITPPDNFIEIVRVA